MQAAISSDRNVAFVGVSRLLVPSFSDCLFVAMLLWVFAAGSGWSVLLADGDTGWHIRTGDYILTTGSVPSQDLFSFSKPGAPWYAWEWLADVVFAVFHRAAGLKGVSVLAGVVLSLSATLLFRHMMWSGANILLALGATLLAAGASTVHYLARPHIFTFACLTVSLWILDRDRQKPGAAVWCLVPLTALWVNLHGGFLAWLACLALVTTGCALKTALEPRGSPARFAHVRRYSLLLGACSLATLVNPYGYRLHQHMVNYLSSGWIREVVEEFQSPRFRSESMLQFEILLIAGIAMIPLLLRKGHWPETLLLLFWAHSALVSARHVPIYAIVAAPICVREASLLWRNWSTRCERRSLAGVFRDCFGDLSHSPQRTSIWLGTAVVLLAAAPWEGPHDFPANKFPLAALNHDAGVIAPVGRSAPRILTSDQWADYLIYRFYPRARVFVDGRSDFYGPEVGRQYLDLMNGGHNWEDIVKRYRFELALIPFEWPLAQLMMRHPDWQVRYLDHQAVLLERLGATGLNQKPDSTERIHRGIRQ
jgi:hypothetical protein